MGCYSCNSKGKNTAIYDTLGIRYYDPSELIHCVWYITIKYRRSINMISLRRLTNRTPGNTAWLLIGFCGISALGWLINSTDPVHPAAIVLFFSILFVIVFSFSYYVTNIIRRSVLAGSGIVGYFLLHYIGLREQYYFFLLLCFFISLELFLSKDNLSR